MSQNITNLQPIICIAGQNSLAVDGLVSLVKRYPAEHVRYIPTSSDKGVDGWQPSLIKKAQALGVKRISLEEAYEIESLVFISLQFAQIIKTDKFKSAQLFNLHFSLLPAYKGVYPAIHPILNGETLAGVTLHFIDNGIDTGNIIAQKTLNIGLEDTARDLYLNQSQVALELFEENLDAMIAGQCVGHQQPAVGASYYSKNSINFAHLNIDFNRTAFEVHNQFRAFTFREYQMPKYLDWSILRSQISAQKSTQKAGMLIEENAVGFEIATVDYNIHLIKDYYPVLWAACQSSDFQMAGRALPYISSIDMRNQQGWNALIIAAYHGNLEIVKLLSQFGANINGTNYKGTTVLMYALSHYELTQNDAVFKWLLAVGVDVNMLDTHGKTIFDYIKEKGFGCLLNKQ